MIQQLRKMTAILLTAVMSAALWTGLNAPPAAAANTAYNVDCSAVSNGDGSAASPFNSLASINAVTLGAGDSVLFKKGTTCLGTFAPQGSGTAAAPIQIGSYGTAAAMPIINANGQEDAVRLKNMQYVELRNLELTAPGDNTAARRGVHVLGQDAGDLYGIVIQNMYIHDVRGYMPATVPVWQTGVGKFANASGGIIVQSLGSAVPTAFHNVQILDNRISGVDRQGIYTWSNFCQRAETASFWNGVCTAAWKPITDVVIRGNQLNDIGGDGIAPMTSSNVLVESNKLTGFNRRAGSPNAGMWTANSEYVTFQLNETSGGKTTLDGMAYDVDHSTNYVTFQYNLSYNNEGGFFLICPYAGNSGKSQNYIIRYNISINDGERLFKDWTGESVNGQIYNNTMYVGPGINATVYAEDNNSKHDILFANNVVVKEGSGTVNWSYNDPFFINDNNVLYNVPVPAGATDIVTANPLLHQPGSLTASGYKLNEGSPALGAGRLIAGNGGRDYFGNPVSASASPNIGAYEGAGVPAASATEAVYSSYFKLDDRTGVQAVDSGAAGAHGSLIGNPVWQDEGAVNGSLKLDGSGDYVSLPSSATPSSADFAVTGWVKLDQAAGTNQYIVQQEGPNGRSWLYRSTATGRLSTYLGGVELTSTGTIPLGQWTHVALAKSGGEVSLYINGQLDVTAVRSVSLTADKFRLGAHKAPSGSLADWNGSLDEFRFYSMALTGSDIQDIYTASKLPRASYKLNESAGATAADASGNSFTGTLAGNPVWEPSGGKQAGALKLDGNGDYVTLPNVLNPAASDFTVSAWVRLDVSAGTNQNLIAQEGATGRAWLFRDAATGRLNSYLGGATLSSASVIPVGQWVHVALAKTDNTISLYMNGVLESSALRTVESAAGGLRIGAHKNPDATNVNWQGSVDNVRFYNQALSERQIKDVFRQG
ncbi:LamG domain-containing protein [Paenibacillus pasadenensis]|uniref:LamG domain-containing protein n=1 Tax=Paenibacillus pasadenensis TaxID=217090 RepID=UPI00203A9605|nr:LamG domain-containing protein [Paenibacillus pasadenensis]MCM3747823.1 LamG domain-containing protein [Paenibacillus pasadenensis]